MQSQNNHRESGFVSLFSVIFFMILISVITLGFLRIMTVEQRQSVDNDLTASALASAESGVEDAKRALIKYASLPTGDSLKSELNTALTSSTCNALNQNSNIRTALGLTSDGAISTQTGLNQYYSCLTVNLNSPDYITTLTAGKSEFIPLKAGPGLDFDQVRISWHLVTDSVNSEGDGQPQNYAPTSSLPQVTNSTPNGQAWSDRGYPAYLRAQFYGFPNGTFNRGNIDDRSRSVFLVPNASNNGAAAAATDPIVMSAADPRGFNQTKTGARGIRCTGTPPNVPTGVYACTALIELPTDPGLRGVNNNYFLRLGALYGATHVKVEMLKSGAVVNFNEVQPVIDSTGRTNDVFRRIQTRVRMDNTADLPEYAVESVDTICKNMQVADGTYYVPNTCP